MLRIPIFRRRTYTFGTAVAVLVLLAGAVLLARFVLHGPVTPERLAVAVAGEVDAAERYLGGEAGPCDPARDRRTYRCHVGPSDDGGTGAAESYVVTVRPGSSCWTARFEATDGGDAEIPAEADGCVRLLQWSPFDRLTGPPASE